MLDTIIDSKKDVLKKLNEIKINSLILLLHYLLKKSYNYFVKKETNKLKVCIDECIELNSLWYYDRSDEYGGNRIDFNDQEKKYPGFKECFYKSFIKMKFIKMKKPIRDKHNELEEKDEKDVNNLLIKFGDLPNSPDDKFWNWINDNSIVSNISDDVGVTLEDWKNMNNEIINGFKEFKKENEESIYDDLIKLSNNADPDAFDEVFDKIERFVEKIDLLTIAGSYWEYLEKIYLGEEDLMKALKILQKEMAVRI